MKQTIVNFQWINVDEELPPTLEDVIVAYKNPYDIDEPYFYDLAHRINVGDIDSPIADSVYDYDYDENGFPYYCALSDNFQQEALPVKYWAFIPIPSSTNY